MANWLIDANGKVWPADSPQLRKALWCSQPTSVLCQYVVTNLGFAQLSLAPRAIGVRWRPTSTTKETLIGLLQHLMDCDDQRVMLSTLRETWSESICGTLDQARATILQEFDTARCARGGYFKAVQRRPDSLGPHSTLGRVLTAAARANGQFDPLSLWQMLDEHAGGRFILTEPLGDEGPLQILAWGKGYRIATRDWASGAIGRPLEDLPDASYGKWAAHSYRAAALTGLPIIEDIDASAWWPGRGRSRIRYTRLVVPLRLSDGRQVVLSTPQAREGL